MNNTQFSIAVHLMAGLGVSAPAGIPSRRLAESINTTPSFVRRTLAKLSRAGLVATTTGKGGACRLARDPKKVTLLEIYRAVEAPKVFSIHDYPAQPTCHVSCGIKGALERVREEAQDSMEKRLEKTTLAQVVAGLR